MGPVVSFCLQGESLRSAAKTRSLMRGFAAMKRIFDGPRFPEDEFEARNMGAIEVVEQAGMA